MRTALQIAQAGLARALDFRIEAPATESLLYRRMSIRQQEIFAFAAQVNPEYYTIEALGQLDAGGIDMGLMLGDDVKEAVAVVSIIVETLIGSPSEDAPALGDTIHMVPASDDPRAYLAPRVRVRNKIIQQIDTDLVDVESIRMAYAYRPDPLAENETGTTEVELEAPFDELLVVDLARWLARKSLSLEPATKTAIIESLSAEEKDLIGQFEAHLRRFLTGRESRQGHTQGQLGG